MTLGNNIELIDYYLKTYSNIGLGITALIVLYFIIKLLIKRKTGNKND